MNKKQFMVLFLLVACCSIFYALRPNIIGFDSYAYYSMTCGLHTVEDLTLATPILFKLIPCNFLAIKLILLGLFFTSVLAIAKIGELFHSKGWLAGAFSFLSPLLIVEFANFENDQFAFPFLFWSIYFFFKAKMGQKKALNYAIALTLLGISALFWWGGIYYILAFALSDLVFFILAIPIVLIFGWKLLNTAIPYLTNGQVFISEFAPGAAMGYWLFLLVALFSALPIFIPQLAFFFLLGMLNLKFAIHAVPLLSVSVMLLFFKLRQELIQWVFLLLVGIGLGFYSWSLMTMPPTYDQVKLVDQAIFDSQETGLTLKNDWDYGYWVIWRGGKASAYGWRQPQDYSQGIILTRENLDCQVLNKVNEMILYKCLKG